MNEFDPGEYVKYSDLYLNKVNIQWRESLSELRGEIMDRWRENDKPFAMVQWNDGISNISPFEHLEHIR